MRDYSVPKIELVIRMLADFDTSVSIDSILLDSGAATAVRPAGLLNGAVSVTATAGGGSAAFIGDIRALTAAIEASGMMFDPVLIMSNSSALILPALLQGGVTSLPIIASSTVPAKTVILVDCGNFASVEGDEPRIETGDAGLLHMEDTTPLNIGTPGALPPPNSVAAPSQSMFQTDCISLKHIQDVDWIMTRSGRVAVTTNVTW